MPLVMLHMAPGLHIRRCTAQASLWQALEQKRPCWQPPPQRSVRTLRSCRPLMSVHLERSHHATPSCAVPPSKCEVLSGLQEAGI